VVGGEFEAGYSTQEIYVGGGKAKISGRCEKMVRQSLGRELLETGSQNTVPSPFPGRRDVTPFIHKYPRRACRVRCKRISGVCRHQPSEKRVHRGLGREEEKAFKPGKKNMRNLLRVSSDRKKESGVKSDSSASGIQEVSSREARAHGSSFRIS